MADNLNSSVAASSVLPVRELNERNLKAMKPGETLWDAGIKGLHCRAFDSSKKFYVFFRTKAGQQRKPKLGEYGAITLAQARKLAQDTMIEVSAGRDPKQAQDEARAELTLAGLWEKFYAKRASKNKSADQSKARYERVLEKKWGTRKLSDISTDEIEALIEDTGAKYPISANRTLALLSVMFNFARTKLKWKHPNPCEGVDKFPENKRKRYMKGEEPARIAEILDREAKANPESVAFLYLLILTGARKGEIAGARWEWVNGNVLSLPDSKTGAKPVYLPPQALDVMARLPRTNGTITGIQSPKKLWDRIRIEAGCPDLRMHDLRHSFASAALGAGFSLSQIGELLGHKSTQTTQRYAHLVEEVATAAATATADRIMMGMKKAPAEARATPIKVAEKSYS
jgi:integrase